MAGRFGNVVNKGRSSGPGNSSSVQGASMYLAVPLRNIAKSLPPNERVKRVAVKPNKIYRPHLTDEQALDVIRKHKMGMTYRELADRTGFSEANMRSICQGVNRGHLLRMVEEGYTEPMLGYKEVK